MPNHPLLRRPLLLSFVLGVVAACSASNGGSSVAANPRGGAGVGNGGGAGTVSLVTGGTGGTGLALGGMGGTASNLPAPWQYFSNDPEFGFKDPSLGDDVKNQFSGSSSASGATTDRLTGRGYQNHAEPSDEEASRPRADVDAPDDEVRNLPVPRDAA
jgi:hypothetical protein